MKDETIISSEKKTDSDFLLDFRKPVNYVGGEFGLDFTQPAASDLRVCVCFPENYQVGMSYLGMRIVHDIFFNAEGVSCERCFLPASDMIEYMYTSGNSLFSIETGTPLKEFDVLAFCINCEVNMINAVKMLILSDIEARAEDRTHCEPMLIAGGLNNPEPVSLMCDAFFIGEIEPSADLLIDTLRKLKKSSKKEVLNELISIEGIYVPASGVSSDQVKRVHLADLNGPVRPINWLVPLTGIVFDRVQVEVQRGCPNQCNFCQARCVYHPYRERSARHVINYAIDTLEKTGYEELSLMGLSVIDHSEIFEILDGLIPYCKKNNIALGIPSIRPVPRAMEVIKKLMYHRRPAMTLAVEAADDELRRSIGKLIELDDVKNMIIEGADLGYRNFKFYFMTGLPGEDEYHIDKIARLLEDVWMSVKIRKGFSPVISASVNCFMPKRFSVFADAPLLGHDEYLSRIKRLVRAVAHRKTIKIDYSDYFKIKIETMLANGKSDLFDHIYQSAVLSLKSKADVLDKTLWEGMKIYEEI